MNLMKYVPNTVSQKIGRSILQTQKHSPTILFGTGVIGVVATAVLTARATLKLEETLETAQKNLYAAKERSDLHLNQYSEQEYKKAAAVVYIRAIGSIAKLYSPAVVVGVATIGSLTGSHRILTNRNTSLMAAYSVLLKGFDEYRARVLEDVGPDKERELRYGSETHEIVEETETGPQVKQIKRVGPAGASIYARFFDESSGSWDPHPAYNLMFLRIQQTYCTDKLHAQGHLFLNEVYERLGLDHTPTGAVCGWVMSKDSGDNYVDFGIYNGDSPAARDFVNGHNNSILLDFNCDGQIYDKI